MPALSTMTLGLAGLALVLGVAAFLFMSSQQPSLHLWVRVLPGAGWVLGAMLIDVNVWVTYACFLLGAGGVFIFRWHRDANPPMWVAKATDSDCARHQARG